jgi:hypothetical protein
MSWSIAVAARNKVAARTFLHEAESAKYVPDVVKAAILDAVDKIEEKEGFALLIKSNGHLDGAWGGNAAYEIGYVQIVG